MSKIAISVETLEVLKNFASINSNLMVRPGQPLTTVTVENNLLAEASVSEKFDTPFGIFDLNKFLGTISLFKEPELDFDEKFVVISDKGNDRTKIKYFYSPEKNLTIPLKKVKMPETQVKFNLSAADLDSITKSSGLLQVMDLKFTGDGSTLSASVFSGKDATSGDCSINLGKITEKFEHIMTVDMLRMIAGDYVVEIIPGKIAQFTHANRPIKYWIAPKTAAPKTA